MSRTPAQSLESTLNSLSTRRRTTSLLPSSGTALSRELTRSPQISIIPGTPTESRSPGGQQPQQDSNPSSHSPPIPPTTILPPAVFQSYQKEIDALRNDLKKERERNIALLEELREAKCSNRNEMFQLQDQVLVLQDELRVTRIQRDNLEKEVRRKYNHSQFDNGDDVLPYDERVSV